MSSPAHQIEPPSPSFASLLQTFFTEDLVEQRALSPNTVATYRDAFLLFLAFAQDQSGKSPERLALSDITPELIVAFLEYLEHQRHNTVRSRNARLAALRAFLKFASRRDVSSLHAIEKALSVPVKRFERPMVGFLSVEEMHAIIATPGTTSTSQRDHLLFSLLYNTGARVSEIITLTVANVVLDGSPCVHLHGKGRKQRAVPVWRSTVKKIRAWLRLNPKLGDPDPLLPNRLGQPMTRMNVTKRLALAVQNAAIKYPDLTKRRISPHVIRHTAAMHLLQSGVDASVIALWGLSRSGN